MAGLPAKVTGVIERDVKKHFKSKKQPWQGFGPIAEAHMSADNSKAIVVWRQGGHNPQGARTNFIVGIFAKAGDSWTPTAEQSHANFDSGSPIGAEAIIKREKARWKTPEPIAA